MTGASKAPVPALGIIAGGGRLPAQIARACIASGRDVYVVALEGTADLKQLAGLPHSVARIGAVGDIIGHLRAAGAVDLIMVGHVRRPAFPSLRPDATGTRLLAHLGMAFFRGDDALIKSVVSFFEQEGFRIVGAETVLADLLTQVGVLGKISPNKANEADIKIGLKEAKSLGERDIGQAVIVANGALVGSEDEDGTDALIARCAEENRPIKGGVLVKAKKPKQEARVDLPTIGLSTVEAAHRAGLAGIALEADGSLIVDKAEVIARADALGIFITGVHHE